MSDQREGISHKPVEKLLQAESFGKEVTNVPGLDGQFDSVKHSRSVMSQAHVVSRLPVVQRQSLLLSSSKTFGNQHTQRLIMASQAGLQRTMAESSDNVLLRKPFIHRCSSCQAETEPDKQNSQTQSGAATKCPTCRAAMQSEDNLLQPTRIQRIPAPAQCRGTNRPGGTPIHERVQADFVAKNAPFGVREYSIPGSSANGNTGYADLVHLGTYAIYEIKDSYNPVSRAAGASQVARYLEAARTSCNPRAPWHLGTAYPDTVIPMGDREIVAQQYGQPGMIFCYTRRKNGERRRVPQPAPVPVPAPVPAPSRERQPAQTPAMEINWSNVLKVVIGLGLSIALVPVVLAALLDPEPASKLALAGLSAVMIMAILSAFGLRDERTEA